MNSESQHNDSILAGSEPARMLENMEIRLEVIQQQVEKHLSKCKSFLLEIKNRCITSEITCGIAILKTKNRRYVNETHLYLEKAGEQNINSIIFHTKLQMETDEVITEAEEIISSLQNDKRQSTENVTSKLPKLELIKYSGEVLKWHEFWDRFSSSVHHKNIRNVDKLAYLSNCLVGKAKEAIVGLETTDANYEIALKVLQERFGKPAIVIDAHYSELFKLKSKNDTISESRRIINEIERHLRILKSKGENIEGAHLRNVIIEKFPQDIVRELRMRMASEEEPIVKIRKHLEHIITARESSDTPLDISFTTEVLHTQEKRSYQPRKDFYIHDTNKRYGQNQINSRKRNIEQGKENYGKKQRLQCVFCGNSHYNDECRNVPSVQERKRKLADRCYLCLRQGHKLIQCKFKSNKCVHCGQAGQHNRALCPRPTAVKTFQVHEQDRGILQTAIVNVRNGIHTKTCRLILDTGSQRSYINKSVAEELKLNTKNSNRLLVYTFGTDKPKEIESPIVQLHLTTRRGKNYSIQVNVMPYITNEVLSPGDYLPKLTGYDLADDGSLGSRIDMLIGNDYYIMFMTNEIEEVRKGLYLINSSFGWIFSGRIGIENSKNQDMTVVTYFDSATEKYFTELDLPLKDSHVRQLWDLEVIGIRDSPKTTQQEEVVKHFNETVKIDEGRYQVKWPYIYFPPDLPTNFGLAFGRLKSVVHRMDEETMKVYDGIFKQQLNDGMIEVVISSKEDVGPVHYLPHHGVRHEGKKLRIVLDASAKVKEENSLNECLYKGPLMLEDLTALLIKFRQHRIAIIADIEKAFLQLGLQKEDRDVTRMLWLKNIEESVHEQNLLHLRFCRVPFGIISSPFLLTATIHHHVNQSNPCKNLVEKVAKRCYVDNLVTGVETKDEAIKLYHDTKQTFEEISMNIRDWNSNDKKFLMEIPEQFREVNAENTKVLGMKWNTEKDVLLLKKENKLSTNRLKKENITKRQVLRVIASVYDPCGFMTPIMLPCKIFLQNLWKTKENWDTKLSEEKQEEWSKLCESLSDIFEYEFPRYLNCVDATDVEIHCFTDASKHAYAGVVYLRTCHKKQITTSLIMSKSRLTPLKDKENLKIPRLELLGCVIGVRLMTYVKNTLDMNITRQVLWTDSTIVLDWIVSNKLLPPFVMRRVEEIKKSKEIEFRYVNTEENPADIATRNEGEKRIKMWLKGPKFLVENEDKWPKRFQSQSINALAIGEGPVELENREETETIDLESTEEIEELESREITATEKESDNQEEAENVIVESNEQVIEEEEQTIKEQIKEIQRKHFPKELDGKNTSLKLNLHLFKDDDGLLRCEGRIGKSMCTYDEKCPILLPGDCELTQKIIQEVHVNNYHVGTSHTLSLIRQQYWIPRGRNEVKKVLKRCPQCVKHGGGPFKLPEAPQLPEERVTYKKPFDFVGLDYFGPVFVSCQEKTEKRWIALYTCLATRAVHMEMVQNLSAEECLLALRRFIAVRGVPQLITSDNATCFKLTAEVLTSDYCIKQKIKWRFIPELAPWHGGFYERLIGLVKNCLKRTLDKHILNEIQFMTIIKEIEAVLNSRPLTYVSTEQEHILKPVDFLAMGKCLLIEDSEREVLEKEKFSKINLVESWKRGICIVKEFEKMFSNQYLLSLRERCLKNKESRINVRRVPKVGEIVQIKDETPNRMCWKVGKIVEIIKGGDGQIRVAKVRVEGKDYRRSIAHLYPLEIEDDTVQNENVEEIKADDKTNDVDSITKVQEEKELTRTSKRNAAERAKNKIAEWTKQLLINLK